jgi:hypothetical protein
MDRADNASMIAVDVKASSSLSITASASMAGTAAVEPDG